MENKKEKGKKGKLTKQIIFNILTILLIIILIILAKEVYNKQKHKKNFENDITSFSEKNKNTIFSINKIIFFSSCDSKNKTTSQTNFTIENLYAYTDIAIFINNNKIENEKGQTSDLNLAENKEIKTETKEDANEKINEKANEEAKEEANEKVNEKVNEETKEEANEETNAEELTTENTLKNVKITNIKFTKIPEIGTGNLYYKNVNNFAKSEINENNKIENELQFETTSENETNLDKPMLYNNCANPITLSYINQNIKTDYTMTDIQNPITYNGKLLKRCGIAINSINTSISFDIEIENNKKQKFKTTVYFDIPYEDAEKSIYDGSIIIEKKTNFNFYRYE